MAERLDDYEGEFEVAGDISYIWSAGELSFDCPCGGRAIILSEGGDTKRCECGKVYRLFHYVGVDNADS